LFVSPADLTISINEEGINLAAGAFSPGKTGVHNGISLAPSALGEESEQPTTQPSKRNASDGIGNSSRAKRGRARKASLATPELLDPNTVAMHDNSEEAPTREFQGLFLNRDHAQQALQSAMETYRKPESQCTFPADDETFPKSDQEHRAKVGQVFNAICDWSCIHEWKTLLPKDEEEDVIIQLLLNARSERRCREATSGEKRDFAPTEAELASILPPIQVLQQKVLRQVPNDQTIEWISWGVVVCVTSSAGGCFR
jgi:hypothetical protein